MPTAAPQAPQMGFPAPAGANQPANPAAPPARPRSLDSFYRDQLEMLQSKVQRGTADLKSFEEARHLVENNKTEGIDKAVKLWHRGMGPEGIEAMNAMGEKDGVQLVSMQPGVEIIDGVKTPTMIVTTRSPDGKLGTVNTAQAMAATRKIEDIIASGQKTIQQDDKRTHEAGTLRVQQQNADTQAGYREDQAENMREQRRLQEEGITAKGVGTAPIWDDKADTFLKQRYTAADPVTGEVGVDGNGLQFAKTVALSRARSNGGDTTDGLGYAFDVDNRLKQSAGQDHAKLRQLRSNYLQSIAAPAPAPASGAANSAEWDARNAASRAGAPVRAESQRDILTKELEKETDPQNIASLQREISRLGPAMKRSTTTNPAAPARTAPAPATRIAPPPAGMPTARPANTDANGKAVDLRNDTVLASLKKSIAALDANDPKNVDALMKMGNARNQRIDQLRNDYGTSTKLITE